MPKPLTETEVRFVLFLHTACKMTPTQIQRFTKVSPAAFYRIVNGKTYGQFRASFCSDLQCLELKSIATAMSLYEPDFAYPQAQSAPPEPVDPNYEPNF